MITKAVALGFNSVPTLLGRVAFGNFRHFEQADVTVLADVQGGKDLVPITIKAPHNMSLQDISEFINSKAKNAKKGNDKEHKNNTQAFEFLPSFLTGPLMGTMVYITQNLGWSVPVMKLRGDSMAPIVITNVGSLGLEAGYAPLPPSACNVCMCVGKIIEKPVVKDGEIKIRKMMTIVHTLDHRVGDASLTVKPFKMIHEFIENPEKMDSLE